MKFQLLAITILLVTSCKPPQASPGTAVVLDKPLSTNNSLLWQVSGNGLTKPSYLYGTIHMIDRDNYFLGKNVQRKLIKSDLLIMELDPTKIDVSALTKLSLLDSGKTVKDYMNDTDYFLLRSFMEDSIGMKRFTFEQAYSRMKPFYIEQLIFFRYLGQEKESYEENFKRTAQERNLPIQGLETFEEQLRFLDEIPLEDQLKSLVKTIRNYTSETNELDKLIRYYKAQDITALTKSFEEDEDVQLKEKLVYRRNTTWVPKLKSWMENKSCFIAVGAGHLGGDNGLIQLLRNQGYTVQPVSIDN
jgi:uncharacterized protein YbaP (TraB family)